METFGLVILVEGLFDYFIRWSKNRQRCLIFPLVHHGKEFVAGIDGRQGAVWGDKQSTMDKLVKIGGMITGLPFLTFAFGTARLITVQVLTKMMSVSEMYMSRPRSCVNHLVLV